MHGPRGLWADVGGRGGLKGPWGPAHGGEHGMGLRLGLVFVVGIGKQEVINRQYMIGSIRF